MEWLFKILFTIANAVIVLFGVGIAAIATIMAKNEEEKLFQDDDISSTLSKEVKPYSYCFLVFGIGLAIAGIIGTVSVFCNIKLLANAYHTLLFVMGVLVLIGAVLSFSGSIYLSSTRRGEMLLMMEGKLDRKLMDKIELDYHCCGVTHHVDLRDVTLPEFAYAQSKLPASCCGRNDTQAPCSREDVYEARCDTIFTSSFNKLMHWGGILMFVVAIYLFAVLVLAALSQKNERKAPTTE